MFGPNICFVFLYRWEKETKSLSWAKASKAWFLLALSEALLIGSIAKPIATTLKKSFCDTQMAALRPTHPV